MMTRTEDKTRKRIERELRRVNEAIEALKTEPRAEELEGLGDNTPLSEDVDAILAVEDSEMRSERLGRLLDRSAALDEALHRLDTGVYGICIVCSGVISQKRLQAVPEALRCMRCQEDRERAHPHEIHEWKRAEETFRERRKAEGEEPTALARTVPPEGKP